MKVAIATVYALRILKAFGKRTRSLECGNDSYRVQLVHTKTIDSYYPSLIADLHMAFIPNNRSLTD